MPDDLDQLATRLARGLTSVRWAEPDELRTRARRRTVRTVVTVPVVVFLIVLAVTWGARAGFGGPWSGPAGADPSATGPATIEPTTTVTTTVATTSAPGDRTSIPIEALLQPDDVGPARHLDNVYTWAPGGYPAWTFSHDQCPAFTGLKITAFQTYQYRRIHHVAPDRPEDFNTQNVFVEADRYPGDTAATVVGDVRRVVAACARFEGASEASSPERPAHTVHTFALLDQGFAGSESLLVRHRVVSVEDSTGTPVGEPIVMTYAVVRVNDIVTIVGQYTEDQAALRDLGVKAAARLCVATNPRC
jgi:hypothetical protein